MDNRVPFNCWKCTACCRLCDKVPELQQFDRGDGTCINLLENGDCSIYDTRPEICNTKKMHDKLYKDRLTWDQYILLAESACKILENNMKNNVDNKKKQE